MCNLITVGEIRNISEWITVLVNILIRNDTEKLYVRSLLIFQEIELLYKYNNNYEKIIKHSIEIRTREEHINSEKSYKFNSVWKTTTNITFQKIPLERVSPHTELRLM